MREAKIYQDPHLGLDSVAKKLKISSNYLSQLVNKLTGKNFADYINTFRVEDAKAKLRNHNFIKALKLLELQLRRILRPGIRFPNFGKQRMKLRNHMGLDLIRANKQ